MYYWLDCSPVGDSSPDLCDSWHVHHTFTVSAYTVDGLCELLKEKGKGGFKGRGQGPGQHCGEPFKKKGLIREGIIEVYLHQLSARLLGWRRSCDPPAIVLELPAGNNQSHCYSRSRLHQLNSWPAGQNYSLQPLREVQRKNLKRNLARWKQWSGKEREIESFLCRIKS